MTDGTRVRTVDDVSLPDLPSPAPGADVVVFDVAAAAQAITTLRDLAAALARFRVAEHLVAGNALQEWEGPSVAWFRRRRTELDADLGSLDRRIEGTVADIEGAAHAAARAQVQHNLAAAARAAATATALTTTATIVGAVVGATTGGSAA